MSYKHIEDIQNIYENISEPVDNQLVSEASAILIDTMFSEGYSEDAIAQFVLNANPDDIVEKIILNAENYIYIDASELNESIDGVEYEIVEENSQQVANLQQIVEAALIARAAGALAKVAKPAVKGLAIAGKRAGKLAGKVGGKIVDKAKTGTKALISGAGTALKPVGDAVKKYGPTAAIAGGAGLLGVPLAIGAAKGLYKAGKKAVNTVGTFVKGGVDAVKDKNISKQVDDYVKKNKGDKPIRKIDPTPYNRQEKPKSKVVPGSEKIIPAKPANASGKELPKARTIGPGKGQINPNSTRGQMIAKNKEIHGGKKIEKLRDQDAAFQKAKKKGSGYSMDDFAKDFPNSNTAKERNKRNRVTSVMDMESYDAFDIVSNYLIESNQVENMDEALYVMSEMDATTIQGIVNEHHQKDENGNTVPHE
tara:strand:+ start:295 stop:1563 length:1269 start_codon:yes stop_codon:yes gene_type:complete